MASPTSISGKFSRTSAASASASAAGLSAQDREVAASVRRDGIACVHNLLTPSELTDARRDFDAAYASEYASEDHPMYYRNQESNGACRTGMAGDHLGLPPGLARLWAHPRIVGIVAAVMGEAELPFLHEMRTNRYIGSPTAPFSGVSPHSDQRTYAMPWEKVWCAAPCSHLCSTLSGRLLLYPSLSFCLN